MGFTLEFLAMLMKGLILFIPVLSSLSLIIVVLGQITGRIENWTKFDALYWSFVTATTIGYGDIRPMQRLSKVLSIIIGLIGLMLTGIIVALTVHAATRSFEIHILPVVTQ